MQSDQRGNSIGTSTRAIMSHAIYRVTSFELLASYTLRVSFDDDTQQTIDFEDFLAGDLYRPLRDLALFDQVQIDPEVHTLVWPNGADFDPGTLHDWPQYREALIQRPAMGTSAGVGPTTIGAAVADFPRMNSGKV
jgi:hypothetical protein